MLKKFKWPCGRREIGRIVPLCFSNPVLGRRRRSRTTAPHSAMHIGHYIRTNSTQTEAPIHSCDRGRAIRSLLGTSRNALPRAVINRSIASITRISQLLLLLQHHEVLLLHCHVLAVPFDRSGTRELDDDDSSIVGAIQRKRRRALLCPFDAICLLPGRYHGVFPFCGTIEVFRADQFRRPGCDAFEHSGQSPRQGPNSLSHGFGKRRERPMRRQ